MTQKLELKRILIFLAVAFGWAFTAGYIVYLNGGLFDAQPMFGGTFNTFTFWVGFVYMPAPAIAHVVTRLVTREGWQNLYLNFKLKQGWRYILFVWLYTAVAILIGGVVFFAIFPQYFDPSLSGFTAMLTELEAQTGEAIPFSPFMLIVIQLVSALTAGLVINIPFMLGEEFGWRAYLQQKLMPLGPRKAMILMGIIWGLWHTPVIMMGYNYGAVNNNQYWGSPWSGILAMTWMTFVVGTLFGWAVYKAGSVWPAVIGHGVLNGLAGIVLLFAQGQYPTLLGPAAVGVIGSIGFTIFMLWAMLSPTAWEKPAAADSSDTAAPPEDIVTAA